MTINQEAGLIDLHTHSTASDGTFSPGELVIYAKSKGIKAFALTDHDIIDGIEEAVLIGRVNDMEVIPGVEISSVYKNREVHILGYYVDYKNAGFKKELERIRCVKVKYTVEKLSKAGVNISFDDILSLNEKDSDLCIKYALEMIKKNNLDLGHDNNIVNYISACKSENMKLDGFSISQCILCICRYGGIPVLAHPTIYGLTFKEIEELITFLKMYGLKGIEGVHPTISWEERHKIEDLALRHNLYVTGGSDFHGKNKKEMDMGINGVSYDLIEKFNATLEGRIKKTGNKKYKNID